MEPKEALALLRDIAGSKINEGNAAGLLNDLGHLPLAIEQSRNVYD
jgi:hypothetical protein